MIYRILGIAGAVLVSPLAFYWIVRAWLKGGDND